MEGDDVRVTAPRGALSRDLLALLAAEKAGILELLRKADGSGGARSSGGPPLRAHVRGDVLPLSSGQARMWFLEQLEPGSARYNVPASFDVRGPLDSLALRRALQAVVQRHEILRTSYSLVEGRPAQTIHVRASWRHEVEDWTAMREDERREALAARMASHATAPFHLHEPEMLRTALLRLGPDRHALLVCLHHIASDGWSVAVLMREVAEHYRAAAEGRTADVPALAVQYADYALWQRELLGDTSPESPHERQRRYWSEHLAHAPRLELPTDRPRPAVRSHRGDRRRFTVPPAIKTGLDALGRAHQTTFFMTLLGTFAVLLHRYSGQDDVCIGTPIANRSRRELEPLIGFFVNTLVLRLDLSANPSFADLLGRVRAAALGAYEHADLPFDTLVGALNVERSLDRHPLFEVMFVFDEGGEPLQPLSHLGLSFLPIPTATSVSKFDLTLQLMVRGEGLEGEIEYDAELFDEATIDRMVRHYECLLESIARRPQSRIGELDITAAGQDRLEGRELDVAGALRERFFHELVSAQAARRPDAVAVAYEDESLTYAELDRRSTALACALAAKGAGPETLVGLCVERSADLVVGMLGILKAGAVYVPLDPDLPAARLVRIASDARLAVVVLQRALRSRLPSQGPPMLTLESIESEPKALDRAPPRLEAGNLAYVIYTSGSTGAPKGAMLTHAGLTNLVLGQVEALGVRESDRVLQFAPMSFDASVSEIGMALASGATLVLIGAETIRSHMDDLESWITGQNVTVATLTPSLLSVLRRELRSVRVLLTAGERCSAELVSRWGRGRALVNAYGPTEITVCATMGVAEPDEARAPSIGVPLRGTAVRVLNRALGGVPFGAVGELFIGGVGLARGYIGRPGLTAERFLPDDAAPTPGARMYRTGDLVRLRRGRGRDADADPELECLGRNDHQVKVRGHRIELGEVESVLASHARVGTCVVVALAAAAGPTAAGLVAYVTPRSAAEAPSEGELREHLAERLPAYMMPSAFVCLPSLPRTSSGKIDRRALPAPAHGGPSPDSSFVAARTEQEEALCGIMSALVGRARVGVRDDFFSMGGHSLLAVTLVSEIEARFGRRLPLASLYTNRTVEQLARLLATAPSDTAGDPKGCLVALRRTGRLPPLFLVHPVGGAVLCYDALARHLNDDQPVYALQSAAFVGGEGAPSIEEMAARYLAEIRRVHPAGPYRLGGWSMGGLVAWEMSRQLLAAGEAVERLVLLDTHAKVRADGVPPTELARLAFEIHLRRSPLGSGVTDRAKEIAWEAFRANFFAALAYEPAPLPVGHRALLVRAAESDDPVDCDAWARLTGERLDIRDVSADHWGLLAGPRLVEVVRVLEAYVRAGADEAVR